LGHVEEWGLQIFDKMDLKCSKVNLRIELSVSRLRVSKYRESRAFFSVSSIETFSLSIETFDTENKKMGLFPQKNVFVFLCLFHSY
jgi:hypothetical protein